MVNTIRNKEEGLKEVNNEAIRANLPSLIKKNIQNPWDFIVTEDIGSCYEIVKELFAVESDGCINLKQIEDRRKNGIHHTPFDVTEHMSNLALQKIEIGNILEVFTTDPGSVPDFNAFCRQTGHILMDTIELDSSFRFLIRKTK